MVKKPEPDKDDSAAAEALQEHPLVAGLRPDPAKSGPEVTEITGLPGDSPRPGFQRLYLTSTLDQHAEFAMADILYSTRIPIESSPFPGHTAVVVSIRRDAPVDYTWTGRAGEVDEFDLDVRLEAAIDNERMRLMSGFTSCAPCYSMGISCTICPSHPCHTHPCPH
jgi:hypothetical protein